MAANDLFTIWGRIIECSWTTLTPDEARAILKLKFKKPDRARIEKLLQVARKGTISQRERDELETYLYIGRVLTLMHSEARRSLKSARDGGYARRKAS